MDIWGRKSWRRFMIGFTKKRKVFYARSVKEFLKQRED